MTRRSLMTNREDDAGTTDGQSIECGSLLADEIVWHLPGNDSLSGDVVQPSGEGVPRLGRGLPGKRPSQFGPASSAPEVWETSHTWALVNPTRPVAGHPVRQRR